MPGFGTSTPSTPPLNSRELRLAVTMNGGVSLAVYMGGVAHELNRLTFNEGPYWKLLDRLGHPSAPTIDVLTGTSAGGINAAALALAQANAKRTDLSELKRLWVKHGQLGSLLRQPFQSGMSSILQGDDYFLPQIQSAFEGLTKDFERSERPIDLTITTTLLHPVTDKTVDDLGTGIVQSEHAGQFHFVGNFADDDVAHLLGPFAPEPVDAFSCGPGKKAIPPASVRALALATRASASFPVAFEPSFIPIHSGDKTLDMAQFASWAKHSKEPLSRFTVDGGVLANTPTKPALEAIQHRTAGNRVVRRVLLLVHPHAVLASTAIPTSDDRGDPPSLLATMSGVLGATSSVGSRSYVEQIDRHNQLAHRWRDGLDIALSTFTDRDALRRYLTDESASNQVGRGTTSWQLFRRMRVRRGGFVLAHQIRKDGSTPFGELLDMAHEVIELYEQSDNPDDSVARLPFVPNEPPGEDNLAPDTWRWGLDMAVGMATSVTELLRDLHHALGRESALAGQVDRYMGLRDATSNAWRKASNARIALDILGKAEEKAATGPATKPAEDVGAATKLPDNAKTVANPPPTTDSRSADSAAAGANTGKPREWLRKNMLKYATRMESNDPDSVATRARRILDENVIDPLWAIIQRINQIPTHPEAPPLPRVTITNPNPLLKAKNQKELLTILMEVEVVGYLVTEQDGSGGDVPSAPIELVQISAQVEQHFAGGFTSDDKLAGMSLNRFGAFLKRSWRANDWIWGRLDAIKTLMLILLSPRVVSALQKAYGTDDELIAGLWTCVCQEGADAAAVDKFLADDKVRELRKAALAELDALRQSDTAQPLRELASLVAYGFQIAAAEEEVPWLAEAVYDDQQDGASGTKSSAFLTRYTTMRDRSVPHPQPLMDNLRLLRLFVDSRLGQESVAEELPSDMMVRTAVTTTAVAVGVISDPASGLAFAKPVTKAVRGMIGAPYWIITALTQRGQAARALAASGLALGVGLVALALLAPLGGLTSTLVPTIGIGSVITVFAYAAARSRSIVHGAALLGLLVPLTAFAVHRFVDGAENPDKPSASGGFHFSMSESTFVTVCVVGLILGTVVIANINAPTVSPVAELGRVRRRIFRRTHGLPASQLPPSPSREVRIRLWAMYIRRGALTIAALAIAVWSVTVLVGRTPVATPGPVWFVKNPADWNHWTAAAMFAAPMIAIVGHGVVVGWRKSHKLRPYERAVERTEAVNGAPAGAVGGGASGRGIGKADTKAEKKANRKTERARGDLSDPAGLAIAWSVVYGIVYVAMAIVIYVADQGDMQLWTGAAAVLSLVLGWMFSVVFVYLIFWNRERRLVHKVAAAIASARREPSSEAPAADEAFEHLRKVGEESAYLIKADGELTLRGKEVMARALMKSRMLRVSGRFARAV